MPASLDYGYSGSDPYYSTASEYYGSGRTGGGSDYTASNRVNSGPGIGATVGSVIGMYWGPAASAVGGAVGGLADRYFAGGDRTTTRRRDLSQQARDKIVYDVMSSDKGLAALASGENISGGYKSSTKGLMAQDLTAKVAGDLALASTSEVTEEKKKGTVICTELARQGLLERELYESGYKHFASLHSYTVRGYQSWAKPIAIKMSLPNFVWLCKLALPIARKRYLHITGRQKSFTGYATVYIAQPICWIIGFVLEINDWGKEEFING